MGELIGFISGNPTGWAVAFVLVGFIIVSMVRGWLLPMSQVKSLLEGRDKMVDAANLRAQDYKDLLATEQAINETLRTRLDATTDVARTTNRVLEAVAPDDGRIRA